MEIITDKLMFKYDNLLDYKKDISFIEIFTDKDSVAAYDKLFNTVMPATIDKFFNIGGNNSYDSSIIGFDKRNNVDHFKIYERKNFISKEVQHLELKDFKYV